MADEKGERKSTGVGDAMKFFGKMDGEIAKKDGSGIVQRNSLAGFAEEWKQLTAEDKEQLTAGIRDGSFTY